MKSIARSVLAILLTPLLATAQATAPATVPADTTSPQGTLKLLAVAMQEGHEAQMRALMYAADDAERAVADAQIAQSVAFASFRRAAVQAFGAAKANEIIGDSANSSAEQIAKVDAAEVKIDGGRATVTVSPDVVYALQKTPDGWKVSIGGLLVGSQPEMIRQIIRDMRDQTRVVQETADELAAGKFATTDDVARAFQSKAIQLHMQRVAEAATRPATSDAENEPATAPAAREP